MMGEQLPHPSSAVAFEWDEGNEEKLARRDILAVDVENVFLNTPEFRRNKRRRSARWLMVGTDGRGRTLVVGVVWADTRNRILRAVTAWTDP